jgi:hypothetical protein
MLKPTTPLILAAVFVLVGCTTTTTVTVQASNETSTSSAESQSGPSPGGSQTAQVGDTITLNGSEDGLTMDVKLVKVVDPAKPSNSFFGPTKNHHFVAFQIELMNAGTKTYSDSPANGAVLIDSKSQQYDPDITDPVGPGIGSSVKIAPGDKRVGYMSFEIPDGTKLSQFQFTLDSGFGPDTGQWDL